MQNKENCHKNVWILSGTADGPFLANRLLRLNFSVFASVVTDKASESYPKDPSLHIAIGKLNDKDQIINFIKNKRIKFVVDATHPFAVAISQNLRTACEEINTPLLVFERKSLVKKSNNFFYIPGLKDIKNIELENKNILLAIGSRFLNETASYYLKFGANVYARVLPNNESISKAFGSCINNSNIAILNPSKRDDCNLERELCDFWKIDYVLCREAGGYPQENWETIIAQSNMKLFLVKRPILKYEKSQVFCHYESLINHITRKF